ncbi:hypothetical protein JCM3774_005162 [Rhodotorula dairenensis]
MPYDVDDDASLASGNDAPLTVVPARAAAIAVALSSISSLVALALVIQVACAADKDLDGNDFALLCTDAVMLSIMIVTGLTIIFLCLLMFGLSLAVMTEVLAPFVSCDKATGCAHRELAVKTICALSISLLSILAFVVLVVRDLRRTLPQVRTWLGSDALRQTRAWRSELDRWNMAQMDEERALVDRAKLPLDRVNLAPFLPSDASPAGKLGNSSLPTTSAVPPSLGSIDTSPCLPYSRFFADSPTSPSPRIRPSARQPAPTPSPMMVMLTPGHTRHSPAHPHHDQHHAGRGKHAHAPSHKDSHHAHGADEKHAAHKGHKTHAHGHSLAHNSHHDHAHVHSSLHHDSHHKHGQSVPHKGSRHDHKADQGHAEHQKTLDDLKAQRERRRAEKKAARAKRAEEKAKRRAHHDEAHEAHKKAHSSSGARHAIHNDASDLLMEMRLTVIIQLHQIRIIRTVIKVASFLRQELPQTISGTAATTPTGMNTVKAVTLSTTLV